MAEETVTDLRKRKGDEKRARARKVAYETAGPAQLARQPAEAPWKADVPSQDWETLKQHMEAQMNMFIAWRFSWMEHYQLLESYILPRRGIFINPTQPTPNTMIRGIPINQNILDSTGTRAMRRAAAGMMSGLMSPSRPWFKLKPALHDSSALSTMAQEWFEEVEDRMYTIMGRSNLYDAGAQMFEDLITFGTSPMIIYEDDEDIIRVYVPCPGEYILGSSASNRVMPFMRLFVMSISAIVEMFGLENCPADVQGLWKDKGGSLAIEKLVAHCIEPNYAIHSTNGDAGVIPGGFTWREAYWIKGASNDFPLSLRGFVDQPYIAPRWAVTSNDAYGRSAGMDVLPDIMQLQTETARKAELLEKQVRPPMVAPVTLKNEPSSILPGRVTYVPKMEAGQDFKPIFQVNPAIKEIMEDLQDLRQQIKEGFFLDLFMMLDEVAGKKMTAYEVAQRVQEKLQVLGPVIERLQNEALGPAVKRVFSIMERKGLLPPLPAELHGVTLGIEYIGMLSLAQKASATSSLEQFSQMIGQLLNTDPATPGESVMDLWNRDEYVAEFADNVSLPKRILNSPEVVKQKRQQRAQMQAKQAQMQQAQALVEGAKNLGQANTGGTALGALLNGGQNGGAANAA